MVSWPVPYSGGYATVVGVEWCLLTNGDEYRIYNSHAPVDVEEKLFRTVRVSDPAQEECLIETLTLLSKGNIGENRLRVLWKAQFIDRNVKVALDDLLSGDDDAFIRMIRRRTPELSPSEIRDSLKRADIRIEYPVIAPALASELGAMPIIVPNGTPEDATTHESVNDRVPVTVGVEVRHLIEAGLITVPLELTRDYRGVHLTATILTDGRIQFAHEVYDSLSVSAGMARNTLIGIPSGKRYHNTNGWSFWRCADPETGQPVEMDVIRQRYVARRR